MLFVSSQKLFSFSRYIILALTFSSCRKKDLTRKVNFKIYDVTAWLTNNSITINILSNISLSKGNQTMKFGQLTKKKYFSSEIIQKMRRGDLFQISFCFLKKLYTS